MKTHKFSLMVGAVLAMTLMSYPGLSFAQKVLDPEQAGALIEIENLTIHDDRITGEVINKSSHPVRDVQLLIRHVWLWNNEFRPGTDDPGMALYHTVTQEIPPGESLPFTYRPSSPLPDRTDGVFETTVSVAGFAELIPQ